MNCIVADDEPLARKGLEKLIKEIPYLNLLGMYENADQLMNAQDLQKTDLLFLDIEMPGMSGIDFLKSINKVPITIITTAYASYALEGYSVDVLDYLLKPISSERFSKACKKAQEYFMLKGKADDHQADFIFVKCNGRFEKIMFDEILFAEALQNYVIIYTQTKKFVTYITLKALEEHLPSDRFIKVHKSYIVSFSKISRIENQKIKIGDHFIPISRSLKEEVMEKVLNRHLLKR